MEYRIAQLAAEIEAARLRDAHQPFVKEAAMTKLYASEVGFYLIATNFV